MYDLSILTISQSDENLLRLIKSIENVEFDKKIEFICLWNGDKKLNISKTNLSFDFNMINKKSYHFSKNNNMLSHHAKGKYLLFINDNMELDKDCLQKSYNEIIKENIGIVGINLRFNNQNIEHAGVFFDKNNIPYHRYENQINYRDPRVSNNLVVPAITGAYLMIEKTEFEQILFEEKCNSGLQDIILCIEYKHIFQKDILYVADATAIHYKDVKINYSQDGVFQKDLDLLKKSLTSYNTPKFRKRNEYLKVRIITEKSMYRVAEKIAKYLPNSVINDEYPEANIHYYMNNGYSNEYPKNGIIVVNFLHFGIDGLTEKLKVMEYKFDHCIVSSNTTSKNVEQIGISKDKISIIHMGIDNNFKPKMTLGLVDKVYSDDKKINYLIRTLIEDKDLMDGLQIVSLSKREDIPTWNFSKIEDFYRAIDYLLIPSSYEGETISFMEALACGTISISPAMGIVSDFPHIEYNLDDVSSLKNVIKKLKDEYLERKYRVAHTIEDYDWDKWALKHIALFHKLLNKNRHS